MYSQTHQESIDKFRVGIQENSIHIWLLGTNVGKLSPVKDDTSYIIPSTCNTINPIHINDVSVKKIVREESQVISYTEGM